jgi:hypothetical protein
MKNKRWLRLTGWFLTLVMLLTVVPAVTIAEDNNEVESETLKPVTVLSQRPEQVDITDAVITYTDNNGNPIEVAEMNPNAENYMKVSITGLDKRNEIGDSTKLVIAVPDNVNVTARGLQAFSNDAASAELSANKLVLSWKNGKQASLEATFAVMPHLPAENDLSGSYALITKSKVMVGATVFTKDKRDRITAFKVSQKNGLFFPESDERSVWTLKHVSGEYYTVYSENSGAYLRITPNNNSITLTDTNEETAQKILVQKTSDGYYSFKYGTHGFNNAGKNAANGFASWSFGNGDHEKFSLCSPSDIVYSDVLIFSINGGTGDAEPKAITVDAGTKITLPGLNAKKNNQDFIGWAEVSNILSTVPNVNHTYHEVYLPGTSYTMKAGTTTLYAVYNSTNRNVQFGIRRDGIIVDEPNDNNVKDYIGHFTVNDILQTGCWVIDINSSKPVNDYYIENNVTAALKWVPSAEEIAAALKKEGNVEFDPESQYIHYYVLKYAGKWKIDGVIRNKAKVSVTYDMNAPAGVDKTKVTKMPGGYQVVPGTDILIGADENSTEIKRPGINGYYFMGWNTKKDGSGEYYSESSTIHLTENLYLYAQWADESKELLEIRITSNWPKGKLGYVGAKITLTAELTGFEGKEYTLQWQYTTDPESGNWTDVPDAHAINYTYILDEETTTYTWRCVAQDIR